MASYTDLTGQRFSHLIALEYAGKVGGYNAWKCRCDCGNEVVVRMKLLNTGRKTYCGCKQYQPPRKGVEDIAGRKFGTLIALYPSKDKSGYWHCRCECGKERDVRRNDLISGNTKTCGATIHHMKDITGQRFGSLIAIEPVGKSSKRSMIWHCQCDCGNQVDVEQGSIKNGNVKSCGCLISNKTDLTGKRFGKLTVLYTTENKKTHNTTWHCRCDCGKDVDLVARYILGSPYPSCGCVGRKIDITGLKFGFLTALYPIEKNQKTRTRWHCRCDCGKERDVSISLLTAGIVLSCGEHKDDDRPDLTDIRFWKLIAKELRIEESERFWSCVCDCGNMIDVEEYSLLHGGPRSCGCSKGNFKDYTGERRGRLTAIRPTGEEKFHSPVYVWRCDCGNEVVRSIIQISKQAVSMCEQCLSKERHETIKTAQAALEEASINRVPVKVIREIVDGKLTKRNTSGIRGVHWDRSIKKWVASGTINGRNKYLGCYDDIEEAKKARRRFVEQHYFPNLEKYDWEHNA